MRAALQKFSSHSTIRIAVIARKIASTRATSEVLNMPSIISLFTSYIFAYKSGLVTNFRTLEGFRSTEGSKGIDVAAFQVFFPTLTSTVHKEEEDYTAQQFFSELGGAAGLVLGISLISIISNGSEYRF